MLPNLLLPSRDLTLCLWQATFVCLVSVAFLCVHLHLNAFQNDVDNKMQSVSFTCIFLVAYGALLLKLDVQEPWLHGLMFVLLLLPVLGFLIVMIYFLYQGMLVGLLACSLTPWQFV